MDAIETKALALVNEVAAETGNEAVAWWDGWRSYNTETEALCRAIERDEAYRQEVSDALIEEWGEEYCLEHRRFSRFIITKPDPLVGAWSAAFPEDTGVPGMMAKFRAAIEARGGKITFPGDDGHD